MSSRTLQEVDLLRKTLRERASTLEKALQADNGEDDYAFKPLPTKTKTEQTETVAYLYIDSANRDVVSYSSPGQFAVIFQAPLENVVRADVVQCKIPLTDPAIGPRNQKLLFGHDTTSPPSDDSLFLVEIPSGSYSGVELCVELALQMNLAVFEADIEAGDAFMRYADGRVFADADFSELLPFNVDVTYIAARDMFVFRVLDANSLPTDSVILTLYVQVPGTVGSYASQVDDIWDVLGFDRSAASTEGEEVSSRLYSLRSDVLQGAFGGGDAVDERYRYGLRSTVACSTKTADFAILSIDVLDASDIVRTIDPALQKTYRGPFMGTIHLRDASANLDTSVQVNSFSYPIQKVFKQGKNRLSMLLVTLYRPDGSIFDLNGENWTCTLAFTRKVAEEETPEFPR